MANYLPANYQPYMNYSGIGQQVYPQYNQQSMMQTPQMSGTTQQQTGPGLVWVDGEIGAKAYQMPNGWPANQPIALWDTNDTVIYLKSINPMGMPNPLQKAHYSLEEQKSASPMQRSGEMEQHNMDQYVRKDEMERIKQEILDAVSGTNTGSTSGSTGARKITKGE